MILEGFEIENWSCIKHLAVSDLPATGVIVLHGPNGTGKSSIIEALRACLIESKSTFKALGRGLPKNSSDKPRVTVTFRAAGESWQIAKQFHSKHSELRRRTSTGAWKLETADPTEAHERTRQLLGCGAGLGLYQLLWLTQAEFRLPEPKELDSGVQAQLRAVLGVLQTDLDDRFLRRVKEQWSVWFSARHRPGDKPKVKKDCPLDRSMAAAELQRRDLEQIEEKYLSYEKMMERSDELEVVARRLRQQIEEKKADRALLQEEYERSLKPLETHQLAQQRLDAAQRQLQEAEAVREKRQQAEHQVRLAERCAEESRRDLDEKGRHLQSAEQRLAGQRELLASLRDQARERQKRRDQVTAALQRLALVDRLGAARDGLRRAEQAQGELETLKEQSRTRPAADAATLKRLEDNRARAGRLRADLEAAAISLTLIPEPAATPPTLMVDGAAVPARPDEATSIRRLVRRRAEVVLPGWGRAELRRGSDGRNLDQIESELDRLEREFGAAVAPFGLSSAEPACLDRLRDAAAEQRAREPHLAHLAEQVRRLAPDGLDALRAMIAESQRRLDASVSAETDGLPESCDALEKLAAELSAELVTAEDRMGELEQELKRLQRDVDGPLRQEEAAAKDALSALTALASLRRDELDRTLTPAQIELQLAAGAEACRQAQRDLDASRLSEGELTIRARLNAADESLRALEERLAQTHKELHRIEGALEQTEGLHQQRTDAALRFGKLTRDIERERLEADAYDRLYALFEECRDKQLGAVMGPIHDRVLRWMKLLRIGSYESIRFNDQFLPERLIAGPVELTLPEESTGTIEQIGLMVRLALGATLSRPEEPAAAVLDDPLTHSDVVRLDRMRAVLKNAAAGDPSSTPPAGPLQVLVFTCHVEWFAVDGARVIDLTRPEVLSRLV